MKEQRTTRYERINVSRNLCAACRTGETNPFESIEARTITLRTPSGNFGALSGARPACVTVFVVIVPNNKTTNNTIKAVDDRVGRIIITIIVIVVAFVPRVRPPVVLRSSLSLQSS